MNLRLLDELLLTHRDAMSDPQIADQVGVRYQYVAARRRALGLPAYRGRGWETRGAVDWSAVDWGLPNPVIAEMVGVRPHYVSVMRRRYAPETVRARRAKGG